VRSQASNQFCGLARALSKLGFCSRTRAFELIREGRVRVNGLLRREPESHTQLSQDRIEVDGKPVDSGTHIYLMLNKPRGLVTTAADEHQRATVFECLAGHDLPFLIPVGRLDKASEGLLLFTNDNAWAARVTDPESHLDKTYHVQVNRLVDEKFMKGLRAGVVDRDERLKVKRATLLRSGGRNSWLEIILDEGRNRHIRRLMAALECEVLRLVRIAIGPILLGELRKGQFRMLSQREIQALRGGYKLDASAAR
jgi:23S rRNA pseudouridine2605 synthase